MKGKISQSAKKDRHNFGVLRLCGQGWKQVYKKSLVDCCDRLNTPKHGPISELFHDWLGVEPADLYSRWRLERSLLNEFVTLRGEIAHRGADAHYVTRSELHDHARHIIRFAIDTDNYLSDYLKAASPSNVRPWRRQVVNTA